MTTYRAEYEKWLDCPSLSESEWKELHDIRRDDKEIESRFFAPLEFGTAGLRGTMKLGLHHMNIHVIRHATQAFANVIAAEGGDAKEKGVVVCYDCRNNSELFAREAACVMAANGIHVRLFDALRPTPELSFAIRYHGAQAGINITASHNPREYNGYKVYWSDGAQLPPQHAAAIAAEMERIDIFSGFRIADFEQAKAEGLIEMIGEKTDEAYLERVLAQAIDRAAVAKATEILAGIEREPARIAEIACPPTIEHRPVRLRGILDHLQTMPLRNRPHLCHSHGAAIEMNYHNRLGARRNRSLDQILVYKPRLPLRLDKNRRAAAVADCEDRCDVRVRRHNNLIAGAKAVCLDYELQSIQSVRDTNTMLHTAVRGEVLFKLLNLLSKQVPA